MLTIVLFATVGVGIPISKPVPNWLNYPGPWRI